VSSDEYKSPAEPTVEDEVNGRGPVSQFGRALRELGVELIHANSPQAKGRILTPSSVKALPVDILPKRLPKRNP